MRNVRLSDDVLISCSAPALMRGESVDDMYEEPGEVAVWRWLAFDRFLKQGQVQPIMRGCAAVRVLLQRGYLNIFLILTYRIFITVVKTIVYFAVS